VIFTAGPLEDRTCPPARGAGRRRVGRSPERCRHWKRQGDLVSFIGTKALRFVSTRIEINPIETFQPSRKIISAQAPAACTTPV